MELIYGANALSVSPRWIFHEHQHRGLEVVGVIQGQVVLVAAGAHYPVHRGQVVTIPPDLPHGWFADCHALLNVLHLVHAPRDLAQRLVPGYQPRLITLTTAQFSEYDTLFTRLAAIGDHAPPQQVRLLRAYLEAFLLTLLASDQEQDPHRAVVHEVAAYMQAHVDEPLAISELARQFLMSEATLRRRFHAVFGIAPKQYLLNLRLEEAQHLLATTHFSVQEIARQLGFFDLAHFSSTFHRRFGLSPSAWRTNAM